MATSLGCLLRFDRTNPKAIAWAQANAGRLVREIEAETMEDIGATIVAALETGQAPAVVARELRDMIGLTERGRRAVLNRIESLIEDGYDEIAAERMGARYADRLLSQRAMTIARSETLRAANEGVRQEWQQAIWNGFLPTGAMRVWIGTDDERIREEHAILAGFRGAPAQVARIDQPFRKTDGSPIEPGEEIQCRCSQGIATPDDVQAWGEYEDEGPGEPDEELDEEEEETD